MVDELQRRALWLHSLRTDLSVLVPYGHPQRAAIDSVRRDLDGAIAILWSVVDGMKQQPEWAGGHLPVDNATREWVRTVLREELRLERQRFARALRRAIGRADSWRELVQTNNDPCAALVALAESLEE